ncbi:MAG: hypothetical protein A3I89_00510 [Candidatus Harrisonbacteria bacterium RIFCSPLOWO2_02_FULL_41_11]|uniref:DUF4012 domain-containing protein n=1 Tax=Candidatus Harrisonbacteria bacterium RIFCSPHIGHO2_02_FULL_42_16 TaxID=1798404 RepID=A0A1G1ZH53_9BACT|nr:MAG: hypothetical protein A3B92_02315 [Candidatus Harrisonbacteria bacterium RIFCSPHIGHO2_02_FULL_42_16]OGY66480.1 MAG: hypothetical protein A3I89_00510 [Candidatus Harrisonbacteria bacterium RIFCSPLOWO2_02_FULL_41_11]
MLISDIKPPFKEKLHSLKSKPPIKFRGNYFRGFFEKLGGQKILTKKTARNILWAAAIIIGIYIIGALNFKNEALNAFHSSIKEIAKIKNAVSELKTAEIKNSVMAADRKIKNLQLKADTYGLLGISSLLGKVISPLGQIPGTFKNLSELGDKSLAVTQDLDYLKNNAVQMAAGQKGGELIKILERLQKNIAGVGELNMELKNRSSKLKSLTPELASLYEIFDQNYIAISLNLYRATDFLGSLISLLKESGDQRLLLIFQNPSEIRPAGGFVGSYGELILNQGNLKDIKIGDIYNADRQLEAKLIPPKELQGLTTNWGARDANWFFDFPTSAKKVISFLEQSKLYSKEQTAFRGAIAINTEVLKTLLEIAGPVELPEYGLVINDKNFLQEIQYEVEAGRDKKPGQNPKKILSVLAPIIFEKLNNLGGARKDELIRKFKNHFAEKDIMIYFKDWKLQSFMENIGLAGEVLDLPERFSGDYLAVVNANIAGGKTDAFMTQSLELKSWIASDGKITDELSITRTHSGGQEKDWWYRTDNKNYLKILVPPNFKLLEIKNNSKKTAKAAVNYNKSGYQYDTDLKSIEDTIKYREPLAAWIGKEFGKEFFGAWLIIPAGETKTLKAIYENESDLKIQSGLKYKFIYEKQSGVNNLLDYSITAPPGYFWEESGKEIFEYQTEKPKAREIIELTLLKN